MNDRLCALLKLSHEAGEALIGEAVQYQQTHDYKDGYAAFVEAWEAQRVARLKAGATKEPSTH